MDTGRERGPAAMAARDRGQARLRAVTATIGAASVLAGGGIAVSLASAANAQPAAAPATSHGTANQGRTAGAGAAAGSSGSSSGSSSSSSSSGLTPATPPSSSSNSGQVTSGGS